MKSEDVQAAHRVIAQRRPNLPGRPSIPQEVVNAILIEAGHRCAVCGTPCPLEKAHIVPWCRRRSHEQENLICLCANCHQRADHEQWGEKILQEYKQNPWVMRQNNSPRQIDTVRRIEFVINMEIVDFDGNQENILKRALAGLLRISPQVIRIRSSRLLKNSRDAVKLPSFGRIRDAWR
jgi:type I restriction enzyme, R subunit